MRTSNLIGLSTEILESDGIERGGTELVPCETRGETRQNCRNPQFRKNGYYLLGF